MQTSTQTRALSGVHPLLARSLIGVLTTVLASGRLRCTPVWYVADGGGVLVSTMREFGKAVNLALRPLATLLVVDPDDADEWVEVRADVTLDERDATAVLDDITERYTGRRPYFGAVVPALLGAGEHPVNCRLTPVAVVTPPGRPRPTRRRTPPRHLPPPLGCAEDVPLPTDHLDLLDTPLVAALATRLPDGRAQTQPVWFGRDDGDLLVYTTLERRKGRNLLADPRATLLVVDPADSGRWVEVRADVELSTADAEERLDAATVRYTRHEHFFGGVYPVEDRTRETRVTARLHPRAVHCDAVHH